jgi:hypothetical protein
MKHSLSLSTFNSSLPFATSRYPSEEAAQRLADQIADVLPGVRLDTQGTWLVFPAGKREKSKYDLCILNSGLQPLGTFRSVRCVIRLLQQLQQKGVLLPGVTVVDSSEGLPCSEHGTAAVLSTEPDQQQAKAIAAALKQIGPVEYRLVQPQGGSNISGGKHAAQAKQQSAKRKVQHQNNVQSTADACRGDQTRRKQQLARHQHGHQLQQQMDQGVGQTPLPKRQRFVDLNKLQGTTRAVLQQRLPQQRRQQQQALTVTTGRHQGVESSSKRSTHGPSSAANFKVSSSSSSKQQQRQLHTSKATAKAAGPSRQKNVVKPMAGQKRGREEQQQQRKQRKQQRQPAPAASARTKQQHTLHQLENSTAALSSLARRQHYQPGVRLALPDGRLPCPAALKQLTDFVALQLPGAVLDSRWLVYPSITKPDKKDIVIRHPDLPQGKFRSSKGLAVFLSTVVGELDRMGISRQAAVIPGLDRLPAGGDAAEDEAQALSGKRNMRQPTGTGSCSSSRIDSQQQQLEQQAQAGPSKVALLPDVLLAGLKAAGGGFQFQGSGSGSGRRGPSRPPGQQNRSGLGLLGQSWCHPPIDASYSLPKKGPVLVLAMFFASAGTAAEGDQGYASHRDRARLLQLQQGLGYKPYSFDLDHAEADAEGGQHVQGNFNSHRGARDVAAQFPGDPPTCAHVVIHTYGVSHCISQPVLGSAAVKLVASVNGTGVCLLEIQGQ